MDENDFVTAGKSLRKIRTAKWLGARQVKIVWRDGGEDVIDLSPILLSHRGFVALRKDDHLFETMKVAEYGEALEWADGTELAAAWLQQVTPLQYDNERFRRAMDELHMSLDGMAARLGIARRLIAEYRKDRPIPKYVALATEYLLDQRKAG